MVTANRHRKGGTAVLITATAFVCALIVYLAFTFTEWPERGCAFASFDENGKIVCLH